MENEEVKTNQIDKKKETIRAIKFVLFSISAGVIEFVSFLLFTLLPGYNKEEYYWVCALASLILSVLWNFTFNRKFTFKSASNVPIAMIKTLAYYVVFAPLSIFFAQMYLIDQLGWNELIVKGIVMLINFITEFLYQRFFVFGKSIDTNIKEKSQTPIEE